MPRLVTLNMKRLREICSLVMIGMSFVAVATMIYALAFCLWIYFVVRNKKPNFYD